LGRFDHYPNASPSTQDPENPDPPKQAFFPSTDRSSQITTIGHTKGFKEAGFPDSKIICSGFCTLIPVIGKKVCKNALLRPVMNPLFRGKYAHTEPGTPVWGYGERSCPESGFYG